MTSYELNRLNDKEFEALAIHMTQELTGQKVERFKSGKDKGVDGRFFTVGNAEGIVQAKHWEKSGVTALLASLTKSEATKVRLLAPARYILVTSVPLSRVNKQSIKGIFSPYLKSEADIFGNEDIQDFLRDHPKIVEQHYKLWLASAEVLRMIFSAPIIGRSTFKLDEVVTFTPKYVLTRCHVDALTILNNSGSIIITGEPGIGKSTLAEQLVLHFAVKGYELCFVENALEEAEGAWVTDRKQIFYFDDFLGRNYLEAIDRNHDSHVLAFMRRVSKNNNKRFILTSRTTILQQGKRLSELFRAYNIQQKEYEVRITNLTPLEKARILYNHLWFGDLAPVFIDQLYINKRYKAVVQHGNFNPRLIAFITDSHKIVDIEAKGYWDYVIATLQNPQDIWRGVFENQLDAMGRLIVALVVFHGGQITERHLRESIHLARVEIQPLPAANEWSLNFDRSYQMTVGAVIDRMVERFGGETIVGLFNPSVGDFVLRQFANDVPSLERFFFLLRDYRSLAHLEALVRNGIVNEVIFKDVMNRLSIRFWSEPLKSPEFTSILASFVVNDANLRINLYNELTELTFFFFVIAERTKQPQDIISLGIFSLEENLISPSDQHWPEFIDSVIGQTESDEELIELSTLVVLLDNELQSHSIPILREHVVRVWQEKISTEVAENGIASDYSDLSSEVEFDMAKEEINKFVNDALNEYAISFYNNDVRDIVDNFDLVEHLYDNQSSQREDDDEDRYFDRSGGYGEGLDQIDDLFERDRPT